MLANRDGQIEDDGLCVGPLCGELIQDAGQVGHADCLIARTVASHLGASCGVPIVD